MLSFASGLSGDREAFDLFVNDRFHYRDKDSLLSKDEAEKVNSFLLYVSFNSNLNKIRKR